MKLKLAKSTWGMEGPLEEQMHRMAEAGYQIIETGIPADRSPRELQKSLRDANLDLILMVFTDGDDHVASLRTQVEQARLTDLFSSTLTAAGIFGVSLGSEIFSPKLWKWNARLASRSITRLIADALFAIPGTPKLCSRNFPSFTLPPISATLFACANGYGRLILRWPVRWNYASPARGTFMDAWDMKKGHRSAIRAHRNGRHRWKLTKPGGKPSPGLGLPPERNTLHLIRSSVRRTICRPHRIRASPWPTCGKSACTWQRAFAVNLRKCFQRRADN